MLGQRKRLRWKRTHARNRWPEKWTVACGLYTKRSFERCRWRNHLLVRRKNFQWFYARHWKNEMKHKFLLVLKIITKTRKIRAVYHGLIAVAFLRNFLAQIIIIIVIIVVIVFIIIAFVITVNNPSCLVLRSPFGYPLNNFLFIERF